MQTSKFPVYLYVKTHKITSLKYFGRTTREDVDSYTYWLRHLKTHGFEFTTEIIAKFDTTEGLREFAIQFSEENNIVKSDAWANLIIEDGFGGGFKPWSEQRREKYFASIKDRRWWTNGIDEVLSKECPEGFYAGRLSSPNKGGSSSLKGTAMSEEDRAKRRKPKASTENYRKPKSEQMKNKMRSKRWWKNEITQASIFCEECPVGFTAGRIVFPKIVSCTAAELAHLAA